MTVARSVDEVLREHVTLEIESIDRLFLNMYVPQLQYPGGVAHFFRAHRGATFASGALMAPMTKAFAAAVHRFAEDRGVPVVRFAKGQRKDDVAHQYLAGFPRRRGCCSSVSRRRRRRCSAPNAATVPTVGPTRGWSPRPRW